MTTTQRIKQGINRSIFGAVAFIVLVFAPLPAYVSADGSDGSSSGTPAAKCTPIPLPNNPGTNRPTGSAAGTYKYNECTGLWENTYYTWSPITKDYTPKVPLVYSCNTSTWKWQAWSWEYSASGGNYEQRLLTFTTLPAGAVIDPASLTVCAPPPPPPPAPSPALQSLDGDGSGQGLNGPGSSSSTTTDNKNTLGVSNNNNITIGNFITSTALTGNASVQGNTTAGGATSGDAMTIANVLNMLQSSSALGPNTATFVANVNGDVNGNLMVDPSLLQPAGGSTTLNTSNNIDVNNNTTANMTNNIDLNAKSGDANVSSNSKAGDATSGDASTVANVVNMMNSMIGANQSFLGVININGNLNGNILVPQSLLDSLIASNGPGAKTNVTQTNTKDINLSTNNNQKIDNNILTNAKSGTATVSGNTEAGNATTGSATNNVTILNLTGNQVIGANSLLVFVNVLGKWVGLIMNAPAGTTAASLGGDITQNTTNNINANSNYTSNITNNITSNATTGDATVSRNTSAGNATTGDASNAVNIANLNNTQYSLSGWFGILFINVFGSWIGGFGVDQPTPALEAPTVASKDNTAPQVFQFVASSSPAGTNSGSQVSDASLASTQLVSSVSEVLGSKAPKKANKVATSSQPTKEDTGNNVKLIVSGLLILIGVILAFSERFIRRRRVSQ